MSALCFHYSAATEHSVRLTGERRFLAVPCSGNVNVLNKEMFDTMNKTARELLATIATDADSGFGSTATFGAVGFPDVCFKLPAALGDQGSLLASSPCFVYSFLEFWPPKFPCMDVPPQMLQLVVDQIRQNGSEHIT